jgi:hypothetical protein
VRILFLSLFLACSTPLLPQTAVPESPSTGLSESDKLQLREAQLSLSQAHIAYLQAQTEAQRQQDALTKLIETFKVKYSCLSCQLSPDLKWIKPEATKAAPAELKKEGAKQ